MHPSSTSPLQSSSTVLHASVTGAPAPTHAPHWPVVISPGGAAHVCEPNTQAPFPALAESPGKQGWVAPTMQSHPSSTSPSPVSSNPLPQISFGPPDPLLDPVVTSPPPPGPGGPGPPPALGPGAPPAPPLPGGGPPARPANTERAVMRIERNGRE